MSSVPRLSGEVLRASVQTSLDQFLAGQTELLAEIAEDLAPFSTAVAELLSGGKRLRPAFCTWGYLAAGGLDVDAALRAAASLELLQASALIHDDVMDASDTRRGRPAAHRRFASLHRESGWLGDAQKFGDGAAILLGDLCLSWADEMLYRSGFDAAALARAKRVYDLMCTEVMAGQYLDLLEQVRGDGSVPRAMRVVRYKTAKYTIERPLHMGAALAGGNDVLVTALTGYGLPLGEAFQLRDDVLGVFGDPAETGKPAGDDLREGKRTLLVAKTIQRATPEQVAALGAGLGDPDLTGEGIDMLRSIIVDTGALDDVERVIAERTGEALAALDTVALAGGAREALAELAVAATTRSL